MTYPSSDVSYDMNLNLFFANVHYLDCNLPNLSPRSIVLSLAAGCWETLVHFLPYAITRSLATRVPWSIKAWGKKTEHHYKVSGKVKSSRSSQQLMWHWGQDPIGQRPRQELESLSHYDKAFLIVVHGCMDTGSKHMSKEKSSWPGLQLMWNSGQATIG